MEVSLQNFIADYKFDKNNDFLGKGAYGETYQAFSRVRGKKVAIKFFRNREEEEASSDEIAKAINLEHPNLIRYYYVFDIRHVTGRKEQVGIMEFADGGSMLELINKPIDLAQLQVFVKDILEGLYFLEQNRVVHSDVKLENILLAYDRNQRRYVAKLADFGLAKTFALTMNADATTKDNGIVSGTPAYMAPEMFDDRYALQNKKGEAVVKYNADLWAVGVLIYALFNQKFPFGTASDVATTRTVKKKILNKSISEAELAQIPMPFRTIAAQCLVKNAKERVKSAKDLMALLERKPISIKKRKIVPPPLPIPPPLPSQKIKLGTPSQRERIKLKIKQDKKTR